MIKKRTLGEIKARKHPSVQIVGKIDKRLYLLLKSELPLYRKLGFSLI